MNVELYLNGPDLSSSTGIYTNSDMTVCAPDGYYQQGSTVRQLLNCTLLPEQSCEACALPCGIPLTVVGTGEGVYIMNIDVGSVVGAIIIRTDPDTVPDGYWALFNSTIYNAFSSPEFGYLAAPTTEITFLGDLYFDCGLVAGSPYNLQVYRYDGYDFAISPGETQNLTITNPNLQLTNGNPGSCVMVIPKNTATPSVVQMSMICGCPTATFDITIECVAALEDFASTTMFDSVEAVCEQVVDQTYYSAPVNGDGTTLGLYDWVFSDQNGQNVLSDGYYYAPVAVPDDDNWFRVENGVIVEFGECHIEVELGYDVFKDVPGACVLNIGNLIMTVKYGVIPIVTCYDGIPGNITINTGTYTARLDFTYHATTGGCCTFEMVLEYAGVEIATLTIPTPVDSTVYTLQFNFDVTQTETLRGFVRCA